MVMSNFRDEGMGDDGGFTERGWGADLFDMMDEGGEWLADLLMSEGEPDEECECPDEKDEKEDYESSLAEWY